jgi:hypothetical protein
MQPHLLYAAFRRQTDIYCWDIRYDINAPVNVYSYGSTEPGIELTNQKRRFGVDIAGRWLSTGDQVRIYPYPGSAVLIWDL